MLALEGQGAVVQESFDAAIAWLLEAQKPDGSFGSGPDIPTPNTNSTGLAGWALGETGNVTPAERAAAWVRGRQADETAPCHTALSGDQGAIAYDTAALAAGRSDGITVELQDQWRRASAQALPALKWAMDGGEGPISKIDTRGYHQAGTRIRLGAHGFAPGDTVCFRLGSKTVALGVTGNNGQALVRVKLPDGSRTRTYLSNTGDAEGQPLSFKVLDAKTLPVDLKARVGRGGTQVVKVRGLAAREHYKVTYRGKRVDAGKADGNGRAVARFGSARRPARSRSWCSGSSRTAEPPRRSPSPDDHHRPPRRRRPRGRGGEPRRTVTGGVRRPVHRRLRSIGGRRLQRPRRRGAAGVRVRGRRRFRVVAVPRRRVHAQLRVPAARVRLPGPGQAGQRPVREHRASGRVLGAVVVRRRCLELDLQLARSRVPQDPGRRHGRVLVGRRVRHRASRARAPAIPTPRRPPSPTRPPPNDGGGSGPDQPAAPGGSNPPGSTPSDTQMAARRRPLARRTARRARGTTGRATRASRRSRRPHPARRRPPRRRPTPRSRPTEGSAVADPPADSDGLPGWVAPALIGVLFAAAGVVAARAA